VVKLLIGNKSDLPDRAIAHEQGAALAKEYGFHLFYETSAKTGEHVQGAFDALALDIVKKLEAQAQSEAAAAAAAAAGGAGQGQSGGFAALGKGLGKGKKDCAIS
jgi:GTPase SAR1 family protein